MTSHTRQDPAERHRQLLAVACAQAEAHGLDTLTPALVAEAAGASKALVFHYFGSTAKLRRAVALDAVAHLDAALEPDDLPLAERPARAMTGFVDSVTAHRHVWEGIWRGTLADDPATADALQAVRRRLLARLVATADTLGFTPNDRLRLLADGWIALVENLTAAWLAGSDIGRDELERLLLSSLVVLVPELPEPARSAVVELTRRTATRP
ncbi:TetR family transcriptional regulator [Isoptericola jiangsuensis]|uniref:TetR family transcriptional regulator n=1 Tax=Isoptericola jiangsuensis TaxID=548579 RepID=A0A2A9F1Z2_9MICO|nr:TetR/AcrR family transcriptional regulator [Isoptericola jiangsuensis]PFG44429.1 TetR family transcriptional regulator [Isoptericola jiangsuensis]